ncbi:PREDICTED: multifunctional protein ADE2-like [Ceratosolen solmsi marchali]|uniref:Multifunctional protein ADE2-like n=1 Tax=Ceratosolen solmsi marchali TaxID=326594 RepID=A0AAJ6YM36_9HYME|nr:PREDICTED: multifunctional protein ADE2-like [Ceratosolen solmsi marchali]
MDGYKLGELLIEGKTKKVYQLLDNSDLCYVENKDRITAGDGAKAHDLEGKAAISNSTNAKVFQLLNEVGIKTAFVKVAGETAFIARKCEMVPIEWVTRRLATGSYIIRNQGVPEGYRFNPPLMETFYKDDANHDPQWCEAQIISTAFKCNDMKIDKQEYDIMLRTTVAVFEILERAWLTRDCTLVDMKIEFGIDENQDILVADVIDSDSWRLWPNNDKRLMKDKQVYRNLKTVEQSDLDIVKRNFKWVADQMDFLVSSPSAHVIILMGSPSDTSHSESIINHAQALGLKAQLRVCSAHKSTEETLRILSEYEGNGEKVVLIAVAGRSNGLGPVLSGNSAFPVINCPPGKTVDLVQDIWSSLKIPSGLGCTTVLYSESAAFAAAQIHALHNHLIWARLRSKQLNNFITLKLTDTKLKYKY